MEDVTKLKKMMGASDLQVYNAFPFGFELPTKLLSSFLKMYLLFWMNTKPFTSERRQTRLTSSQRYYYTKFKSWRASSLRIFSKVVY